MATMNTADIGFEKEIWRAADKMRGNIDASEYKSVVLGLIFLKYISDKFETKYRQLVDEGEGLRGGQGRIHRREHLLRPRRGAGRPSPRRPTPPKSAPPSTTPCGPSSAKTGA